MPRVGLISDTHGRLDPRVLCIFADADVVSIVHAGDIGTSPDVLWELEALAPVTAVLGNCDREIPGFALGGRARVTAAGVRILAIHDFADLGEIPNDVDVIVCGHSHRPNVTWHGRVLVVNPGSASQRRRMPGTSVAILEIGASGGLAARIVALEAGPDDAE